MGLRGGAAGMIGLSGRDDSLAAIRSIRTAARHACRVCITRRASPALNVPEGGEFGHPFKRAADADRVR
jgi:hypothetical protein